MRDRLDRWADPPLLVLASLAEEPKHGYAITQDIADTMGVRLSAGTLYAVISRLESRGLIEALEVLRGVEGISFVQFDERDVVRHCLVQRIVKAYERYNETSGTGRQLSLKLTDAPSEAAADNGAAAATSCLPPATI